MSKRGAVFAISMTVTVGACLTPPGAAAATHADQLGYCTWEGTAPICDGDCGSALELDRAGDPSVASIVAANHRNDCWNWQSIDFGQPCTWGGTKALCWFITGP
jgi:hypothetical protein